jgi:hypothetical protein
VSVLPERPHAATPRKWLASFGRFWWEFLVGDTPELLVGTVVAVGLVALIAHHATSHGVTVVVLPVLVIMMLATSVARARRAAPPSGSEHEPD